MNLVRYNPSSLFDLTFDRFFDDAWNRWGAERTAPEAPAAFAPRVDIRDDRDAVVLTAELPGVERDSIQLEVENRVLTLSGEKRAENVSEESGFYRSERVYGAFKRSFRLPEVVDPDKIQASYTNGVLKIALPKRPEAAPKQIEIQGGEGDVKQINVA